VQRLDRCVAARAAALAIDDRQNELGSPHAGDQRLSNVPDYGAVTLALRDELEQAPDGRVLHDDR
jgi:hypothetical protein